jgi:hypothetical protein
MQVHLIQDQDPAICGCFAGAPKLHNPIRGLQLALAAIAADGSQQMLLALFFSAFKITAHSSWRYQLVV